MLYQLCYAQVHFEYKQLFSGSGKEKPFSSYVTVNHEGVYTPAGGACWRGSHRPLLGQVTKERAGPWPAGLSGGGTAGWPAHVCDAQHPELESCPPLAHPLTAGASHALARESAGPCWLLRTPAGGGVPPLRIV